MLSVSDTDQLLLTFMFPGDGGECNQHCPCVGARLCAGG